MTMQVLPALEVKNKFGKFSTIVDRGEIVTVTKHGEPTMVVLPVRFAQEIQRALRLYYVNEKVKVSDGILEWLVEPALPEKEAKPTPVFDEQAEKQKIREMIAKELGIPVPKPSTREEASAFFDQYYEDAKNRPLDSEFANMTDEEYEAMVAKEIKAVRAEKQAEASALVDSH